MSSSELLFAIVETGIRFDAKLRAFASFVRTGAISWSTWVPVAVLTTMPVRVEIVAALVQPLVELQPASIVEALATSLTTTATSPLHVIGFVSRRMLESVVTAPAITTAYFTAFGPVGCLMVRSHLPLLI